MTENEEIVGLAILQNQREAAQAFETGSNKGKSALCMPLLAGKPFALSTDNPESVAYPSGEAFNYPQFRPLRWVTAIGRMLSRENRL
jgi:hypothetical protein